MAQYRQSGMERYGALNHHYHHNSSNGALSNDRTSIGIRSMPYNKQVLRARRSARSDKLRLSIGSVVFVLFLVLIVTILAYFYISGFSNRNDDHDKEVNSRHSVDDDSKSDLDFFTNLTRTRTFKLSFGKGSTAHGRDSRYWDKDDRRRDDDYDGNVVARASLDARDESFSTSHVSVKLDKGNKKISVDDSYKGSEWKGIGLYNEAGRNELKIYEAEYEESLKSTGQSGNNSGIKNQQSNDKELGMHNESINVDNEYDDNVEFRGNKYAEYDDSENDKGDHSDLAKIQNKFDRESSDFHDVRKQDQNIAKMVEEASSNLSGDSSLKSQNSGNDANYKLVSPGGGQSTKASRSESKKKAKRRKFSGSCEMKISNSTTQLVEPLESQKFARFFLLYTEMENKPDGEADWEPRFAGHQSLQEREESFLAHDQKINCGFVKAPQGYQSTGFDLAEDDANYISRCHIAVISCIFGNSDHLRTPAGKTVTRVSRKNVCFVLFMDELTLQTLSSDGHMPDRTGFIGLWRIVVVRNLPYTDMRRVGKIPKLLSHRLFPSARYSIWLDSKLRLQLDPILILEYFLWRKGYEYAISNHYDRHCVWDEVAQNKRLNKYNHTVIDQQFEFYQADGLKRFDPLDPNKLLPSNVPEGSFIVRAHTPMSNLFSCLWFNEVDRFTSRDQLSFAYTYQKLRRMNPGKMFYLNMFKDCERRTVTKLFRHRSEKRDLRQQEVT